MSRCRGDRDRIHVLTVDDDPQFVALVKDYLELEAEMLAVTTAVSAADALTLLEDGGFDCVVSDYEMPGMDGLEFLREVRRVDEGLPFIMFTGQGSEAIAREADAAGVTEYLQKARDTAQYATLAEQIQAAVR